MTFLAVRVTPRSSKNEIVGWSDGSLHVRVTAPPDDGKANTAVCALVAGAIGVPKSAVSVTRGHAARMKTLSVDGVTTREVETRLALRS